MRTFPTHISAIACALRVQADSGRKPRVEKVRCVGSQKQWTVREAHA